MISSLIPRAAVGDKYLLAFTSLRAWLLQTNLDAFVLDYCARQKFAGISFKYFLMKQLPMLPPDRYEGGTPWAGASTLAEWVQPRVLELSYTAWDMEAFARDIGDGGAPFVWDEERRYRIRAELDAAFFHLYGVACDDLDYIMDSFGAFRRNDPERFARTKTLILEIYDEMAAAMKIGEPYQTILDPPPGHGPRHPSRTVGPAL